MNDNNFQGNNRLKVAVVSALPIFLIFIVISIHTIVTKDSMVARSLASFGLIGFTSLTTLLLYTYLMTIKRNK